MSQRDTSSEAWRAECEARYVADMPQEQRGAFLRGVAKHRGPAAARALRDAAKAVWIARQAGSTKAAA